MTETYDGVIVGSGQHGLVLGANLAQAGLEIAILERRLMYWGCLETVEPGPAGFHQNLHSINHFNISKTPWYRDLELSTRVKYITPQYDFAQPHADGTALVFSRDIDETCASIARFSKKDAETFREWNIKADKISDDIFLPERFSEPLPEAERDELLSRSPIGRDFLDLIDRQPLDAINELVEDERVRLLLLFKLSLFGTVLYDALSQRSPMGALVRGFDLAAGYEVCVGGSFNLARGLTEVFIANGGEFINHAHVENIDIQGSRATGVHLADGREIRARHFGYKTPFDNLYMVGSPTHPGGAISGGGGYISAGVIARDLGIEPWWNPTDAHQALSSLADAAVQR